MTVLNWLQQPTHQLLLLAVLTTCLLIALLLQGRRIRRLQKAFQALSQQQVQLNEQLQQLQSTPPVVEPAAATQPFSAKLQQVEQQVERPLAAPRNASEKYRYVAALAEQGMTATQIAQALKISEAEARQTIQLARLTEPHQ